MGQIRDQLQNLTAATLVPIQLSEAGGKVFVSSNAVRAQNDLQAVVQFWRDVHAPTYGLPIPSSGKSLSEVDTEAVFQNLIVPAENETYYVNALSVTNASPLTNATVTVKIGAATFASIDVGATNTEVIVGYGGSAPIFIVKGQELSFNQSGGGAGTITAIATFSSSIQG